MYPIILFRHDKINKGFLLAFQFRIFNLHELIQFGAKNKHKIYYNIKNNTTNYLKI